MNIPLSPPCLGEIFILYSWSLIILSKAPFLFLILNLFFRQRFHGQSTTSLGARLSSTPTGTLGRLASTPSLGGGGCGGRLQTVSRYSFNSFGQVSFHFPNQLKFKDFQLLWCNVFAIFKTIYISYSCYFFHQNIFSSAFSLDLYCPRDLQNRGFSIFSV